MSTETIASIKADLLKCAFAVSSDATVAFRIFDEMVKKVFE